MGVRIQVRRDTAANWTTNNPTLVSGEIGFETDTNKWKFGDGATAWTALAYVQDPVMLTAIGLSAAATDMGTYATTNYIANNTTVKASIEALDAALASVASGLTKQSVVADITARDALAGNNTGDTAYVVDASADATVTSGAALYVYNAAWIKIAEFESMDLTMTFIGGTDTPANFTGAADQLLYVNSAANAVEFRNTIDGGTSTG